MARICSTSRGSFRTRDPEIIRERLTRVGPLKKGNPTDMTEVDKFIPTPAEFKDQLKKNDGKVPYCFLHIPASRCKDFGTAYIHKVLKPRIPGYRSDMCVETTTDFLGLERMGLRLQSITLDASECSNPAENDHGMTLGWFIYYGAVILLILALSRLFRNPLLRCFRWISSHSGCFSDSKSGSYGDGSSPSERSSKSRTEFSDVEGSPLMVGSDGHSNMMSSHSNGHPKGFSTTATRRDTIGDDVKIRGNGSSDRLFVYTTGSATQNFSGASSRPLTSSSSDSEDSRSSFGLPIRRGGVLI